MNQQCTIQTSCNQSFKKKKKEEEYGNNPTQKRFTATSKKQHVKYARLYSRLQARRKGVSYERDTCCGNVTKADVADVAVPYTTYANPVATNARDVLDNHIPATAALSVWFWSLQTLGRKLIYGNL